MSQSDVSPEEGRNPISGIRLFQVVTGVSEWTPEEHAELGANPEWQQLVREVSDAWKQIQSERPEAAKILRREFRRILRATNSRDDPSTGRRQ